MKIAGSLILAAILAAGSTRAQTLTSASLDPGPRAGPVSVDGRLPGVVGGPLPGLTRSQTAYFQAARSRFQAIDSVSGKLVGEAGSGLGPKFNLNSCSGCHAFPTVGGSSPRLNPQVAVAMLHGARNSLPGFIKSNGPVREARFAVAPDGTLDGAVHQLFTIAGRTDARGCVLAQPNFAAEMAAGNVGFRIPTPLFGLGLVEAVPDINLVNAFNASTRLRTSLGISGHFNHSGNDTTITRFGWKAQNKSLLIFAGEAYNVEMGVSNELFPNEINSDPSCTANLSPEDVTILQVPGESSSSASNYSSDIVNFAGYSRLSMPPLPLETTTATKLGKQVFMAMGCQACHTQTQTTGMASSPASISQITFQPYSDFAVHHMGTGLADGIIQGSATGDEFRSAPLWGIGQRLFFLHDGRTNDLDAAIKAHAGPGSEANVVVQNYKALPVPAKRLLLQFLRSL